MNESIKDLKMEWRAASSMAQQLQAALMKLRRHAKYERLDEQLQQLISSLELISRDMYFKQARAFFHF